MLWRDICVPVGFSDVRVFDEALRRKCRSRLAEEQNLSTWREVFRLVSVSAFCRGEAQSRNGSKPWRADFRWIVANGENWAKVLEGRYDNGSGVSAAGGFVG
jgi:hypothetical protein